MQGSIKILHLEDDVFDAELLSVALADGMINAKLSRVDTPKALEELLEKESFDLAICDYNVPGFNGFHALKRIREIAPDTPVIIVSGTIGDEEAVECLKHGATDYILKDRLQRVAPAIERALAEAELKRDHERAYRALRLSEERLSCVLLATNDAVYDWNLETNEIWWNNGLEILFGYDPKMDSVHFNRWKSTIHPEDRAAVMESLEGGLASKMNSWSGEYRFRRADGEYATVIDRGHILRDETGRAVRMVGSLMDLTERKRLEGEVLRAQRMDTIGAVASGVAHDLNNMLSPILVASEILGDYVKEADAQPLLDMIKSSVQRGSALVRQILGFARGANAAKVPIDLRTFGKEALPMIRAAFPRNIEVEMSVSPDVPSFMGQPIQVHQLVLNLCVNARDAMTRGGKLRISAEGTCLSQNPATSEPLIEPREFVMLCIADTGEGIQPEHLARIFEPFFTTKREGSGTGIGLSTVKQIVERHQGFITVESVIGTGTTFRLYFPAISKASAEKRDTEAFYDLRGRGEVVLIVEQEQSLSQLMRVALETHDYIVLSVTTGEEALDLFKREGARIGVVIAAWDLAGMGGRELLAALRRLKPELRMISATGSRPEKSYQEGEIILPKPFSTETLLRTIKRALVKP